MQNAPVEVDSEVTSGIFIDIKSAIYDTSDSFWPFSVQNSDTVQYGDFR